MKRMIIATSLLLAIASPAFADNKHSATATGGGSTAANSAKPAVKGEAVKPAAAPTKGTTTASGLRIDDITLGNGTEAVAGKNVTVHYTGWLDNNGQKGKQFDSSIDRGEPFQFGLGAKQVIAGWDEGVAGLKVGGKRTLYIPSKLGYGARGAGAAIPPNANLIFDVELLAVN